MRIRDFFLAALHGGLVQSILSPGHGRWKTLAPIPLYPRQEHTTVLLNSTTLAILGGITPRAPTDNTTNPIPFDTTPLLQTYHIPSNTWSNPLPLPALPIPLNHPNAAVVDGKLYLLGGLSDEAADGVWRGTGRSWVLDLHDHFNHMMHPDWTELPSMPADWDVPRGSAAVGVDRETGLVYLAGGMKWLPVVPPAEMGPMVQESVDVVSAFDTRRGVWVRVGNGGGDRGGGACAGRMPGRRDHAGCAVVDRVMYVLGGRDTGQVNVRGDVFALDLRSVEKGWVTKKGRMPTARGGVCAAAVGGKVYVLGGEGNPVEGSDGVFDQVEVYDTKRDRWERLDEMKVSRHGTSAVAVKGGVYIPGGGTRIGVPRWTSLTSYTRRLGVACGSEQGGGIK
ncbi:galactose oxidase [Parathielavia hyrcaniae]|uniref:Galactose oxidase n=1 Tax=Parathielavia hyrcaniae TaxID=113614 RepID=A0AAN6SWX4_9PEZI|nr:galactose oxidase [Parathielavia hyrcaniae]